MIRLSNIVSVGTSLLLQSETMIKTEEKCHVCGGPVHQAGPNIGQCTDKNCGAEHTVINALPDDDLSDCEHVYG